MSYGIVTRIDLSEMGTRCFQTDHNQARLLNRRRELASEKHGNESIEALPVGDVRWLAILIEEVGEVARTRTYDSGATLVDLADELVDVMAVCGAWLDALREAGIHPDAKGVWLA